MTVRTFAALAAATVAIISAPAFADTNSGAQTVRIVVPHADLDLSSVAGVKTLRHRVADAMEAVCGSYAGTESSADQSEADAISRCRAVNRAVVDQKVAAIISSGRQLAAR